MKKKELKRKLAIFYEKLSIIRKSSLPSRSMKWVAGFSEKQTQEILNRLNLKKKAIADIGGADGEFIFNLFDKQRFDKQTKCILIDISLPYLKRAKERYNREYSSKFDFDTICQDVDEINMKEEFDFIFFRSIVEHLYFPDDALKNLNRALKPNGFLLIVTPNRNRLNEIIKKIIPSKLKNKLKFNLGTDSKEVLLLEKEMNLKEHIHEYTKLELKTLLKVNNFKIKEIKTSKIPVFIPSICDRFSLVFSIQKIFISFLEFFAMNRFFGFDLIFLVQKNES